MEVHLKKAIVVLLVTFSSATYDFVVKPEFGEKPKDLNITAYVGQTSRLPCTVKHLSGKRVSWIRQRDLQVLSTGRHTFSTDLRISVLPGTRFKLRRPRNIILQGHHRKYDLEGTSEDEGYPATGFREQRPSSSSTQFDSLQEGEVKDIPGSFVALNSIGGDATPMWLNEARLRGSEDRRDHHYPLDRKKAKRKRRTIHRYKYKRQKKNYWYKDDIQIYKLPPIYDHFSSFAESQKRSKKAISAQIPQGFAGLQSPAALPSLRGQSKEQRKTQKKETNPIAIYPQGPISIASDSKNLKLAPNYIDGVWEPEDYTLQIKYTKPQDAGTYICQINTEPRITQAVILRVVKMRAEILSRRELFVKAGNPVKLSCRVNHGALSPGFILWYKGERLVEYENSGGRIQVQTEAGGVSHLLLNNAQLEDSSNYTCSPAAGEPASLILTVIVDERQAAMQQGNHCPSDRSPTSTVLLCSTLLLGQLLSYPAEHLQPVARYLISSVFFVISYFSISLQIKIAVFALIMILLTASVVNDNDVNSGKYPDSESDAISSSSCGLSSASLWRKILDLLLWFWSRNLDSIEGIIHPPKRRLQGDFPSIFMIGFVVCMCVFMFPGRHNFVSDVI